MRANGWRVYLLVLWFDITHTHTHTNTHKQRHTADIGASRLTHQYKYTLTLLVMFSQQLSVLHWMNNLLISKIYFADSSNMSLLFKNFWLAEVTDLMIRMNKTKFFVWNTKNTENKEAKHTLTRTQRKIRLDKVSQYEKVGHLHDRAPPLF